MIANAQINSFTGFLSAIGYIAIFFVIAIGLVSSSFSIIHILPDTIFGFMGIQQSNTQLGRDIGDAVKSGTLTGAGVARGGGAGSQMTGSTAREAKRREEAAQNKRAGGGGVGPGGSGER